MSEVSTLRWKKKGGCWRAQTAQVQFKIVPMDDGGSRLSMLHEGEWLHFDYGCVEDSKGEAEKLAEAARLDAAGHAAKLHVRRAEADRWEKLPDMDKTLIRMYRVYRTAPEHERAELRQVRPDIAEMFDRLMAEEQEGK